MDGGGPSSAHPRAGIYVFDGLSLARYRFALTEALGQTESFDVTKAGLSGSRARGPAGHRRCVPDLHAPRSGPARARDPRDRNLDGAGEGAACRRGIGEPATPANSPSLSGRRLPRSAGSSIASSIM